MIRVLILIGTRPETIKMAPVIKELKKHPDQIVSLVCVSGQHQQLIDQVLDLFQIVPDHALNVMVHDQKLSQLTANLIDRFDPIVRDTRPNWILAQGDTTTAMVAALVSYYHQIPFGHVEAGLRTSDIYRPFPEELNRRIADLIADIHFAPTDGNRRTLIKEGILPDKILLTGNTVVDALLSTLDHPYDWSSGPLANVPRSKKIVLVTAHRRESFGTPLREICLAIRNLAAKLGEEFHFVYPVHLNPNVRQPVSEILANIPNVTLIEPLDYLSMIHLMKVSKLILTDSGGIQEEAPTLGIPVLVMRDKTERTEAIEAGVARLVGRNHDQICEQTLRLLRDTHDYSSMARCLNLYGDGKASERIVSFLLRQN